MTGNLVPADDFTHRWPDLFLEHFTRALECTRRHMGRNVQILIGYTARKSSGALRRRAVIFVQGVPMVEFVGADSLPDGPMASLVKHRDMTHVDSELTLPDEYELMPTDWYREVVDGPHAYGGLAVICDSADHETMIGHALIRWSYKQGL